MIDWLASKIGTLIAIGVITGFILALFAWQHGIMVDREGQNIADNISGIIDNLNGLDAETLLNMTFGNEPDQLPASINGKAYELNITTNMVIITQGRHQWVSQFMEPAICQNLSDRQFNITGYEQLETETCTGTFDTDQNFIIERASIDISGEIKYITLIYIN